MSIKQEKPNQTRQLTGALAATLGLIAIACGDDDDDAVAPGTGGSKAGSSSSNGGKAGSSTSEGGKPGSAGTTSTAGRGGSGSITAGTAGSTSMAGAGGEGGAPAMTDADIASLNALLTAEYNAITAYSAGAGLINGAPNTDPLYALRAVIVKIAVDIQSQHKLHAAALVDAIDALNGTPVVEADVAKAFKAPKALTDVPTITNVLKFAASAERGAAVAYNQVIGGLEDAKHRFIAASIEGDETQHFIVLTALVLGLASPGAKLSVDTAGDVIPEAFVSKVGNVEGLNAAPPDYFP
jgi:hypothetical protein